MFWRQIMMSSRIFVAVIYVLLGASFIASTGVLINEFFHSDWLTMVAAHSHLFLFFPVFGILALVGFYVPSVVLMDLYWTHVPYGKLRFVSGLIAIAAFSFGVCWWLDAKPRAIWEVSLGALIADKGEPVACDTGGSVCQRAPMLDALSNLRLEAQKRVGLTKFARNCNINPYLEVPEDMTKLRWCFPAQVMLTGIACCQVQNRFSDAVARLQADPSTRSLSAKLDVFFMPLKIFFVLVLIAIGCLLAARRRAFDLYYADLVPSIERGVIIGALAMLLWLLMDYAYQETTDALFGRHSAVPLRLSLVIAPWALLLLFYFLRHLGEYSAIVGQISGVVVAAVYVWYYENLNDLAVRFLGIGADKWAIACLLIIALLGMFRIAWRSHSNAAAQGQALDKSA
jgi:hypothetical protein